MTRQIERKRGLFLNGHLWWVRVRTPGGGAVVRRSTGCAESDLKTANRVLTKLEEASEERTQWPWIERIVAGDISVEQWYNAAAAGKLDALASSLIAKQQSADDVDVEPWVSRWRTEHLALADISEDQRDTYERQVRALIPTGVPFPRSQFTEDYVKATLLALPCKGPTKRRYLVAWELFYRYAKKRVPLLTNPFEDVSEWRPANGSPRSTFWDHDTRIAVLDRMTSPEAQAAMTLVLGTGIELGALLALRHGDIGKDRTIVAHGSKNQHREDRTVFVDEWAWKRFKAWLSLGLPNAPVFSLDHPEIRKNFYAAQVAQGLIAEPPVSENFKKLWKRVNPHTIHDARHTYCFNRALGLDGEARQGTDFLALQLGHADEQMVTRVYKKANIRQRLALRELAEAKRQEVGR